MTTPIHYVAPSTSIAPSLTACGRKVITQVNKNRTMATSRLDVVTCEDCKAAIPPARKATLEQAQAYIRLVRLCREDPEWAACRLQHERAETARLRELRALDEWSDDDGDVLWWSLPVREPPHVGSPLDDNFPGHVTHWTRLVIPEEP